MKTSNRGLVHIPSAVLPDKALMVTHITRKKNSADYINVGYFYMINHQAICNLNGNHFGEILQFKRKYILDL